MTPRDLSMPALPIFSRFALSALIMLTSLSAATPTDAPRLHPGVDAPPPRMLWAWERPTDLRFLGARRDVGQVVPLPPAVPQFNLVIRQRLLEDVLPSQAAPSTMVGPSSSSRWRRYWQ